MFACWPRILHYGSWLPGFCVPKPSGGDTYQVGWWRQLLFSQETTLLGMWENCPWRKVKGPILCPLKDDPEAIKHTEATHQKWLDNKCKCSKRGAHNSDSANCNCSLDAGGGKQQFIKYKNMRPSQQTKMHKDVLAATTNPATAAAKGFGPVVFL